MATAWSFAIDDEKQVAETVADASAEAERLGRRIVGEPNVSRATGENGAATWWVTVSVERCSATGKAS
jgi:hypothetical protein